MPRQTRSYREALLESLSDPIEAVHYLNAAIDDSPEMFLKALRNVAQARQMAKVARDAGVTRESLYRATSEIGNPTLETLDSVLAAVGIKIKFEANQGSVNSVPSTPSQPTVASHRTSGFGTGRVRFVEEEGTRQGVGNSVGVLVAPPGTNVGVNYAFELTQGTEESWLQKITSQHNRGELTIGGQTTSPLAMQTTCNWSQLYGT